MQQALPTAAWRKLLAEPGENGHIVQLYQDDDFYGEAISHFAAEGLARGESIILVATKPHWKNISRRLLGKGFDVDGLFRQGQLTLLDADDTLPKFMAGNLPDGGIFKPLAKQTIAQGARRRQVSARALVGRDGQRPLCERQPARLAPASRSSSTRWRTRRTSRSSARS